MSDTNAHLLYRSGRVVGQFFLGKERQAEILNLPVGTAVTAVTEPDNEHDPLAVSVQAGGQHIGYLPKEISPVFVLFLNAGYQISGEIMGFAAKGQSNPMVTLFGETP